MTGSAACWLTCAGLIPLIVVCIVMAPRSDRRHDARRVIAQAEALCRAAARDPYAINPEETDQ